MALSDKEKLLKLQQKQEQLKQQEKELKKRIAKNNRKADTHRKIQVGAAVESVCHIKIEEEDIPKLISFLKFQERGYYFSKAMGYSHKSVTSEDGTTRIEYFKKDEAETTQIGEATEEYSPHPFTTTTENTITPEKVME